MQCPRCDGQGEIKVVRVQATGAMLQLCDECDATWPYGEMPSIESFQDFGTFMKANGLQGLWSEVTVISEQQRDQRCQES